MAGRNIRVTSRTAAVSAAVREAAARAVVEVAEDLGTEADDRTPVDQGDLRRSREVVAEGLSAAVTYDTPYAVAQHEDPTLNHPRGGEARWLENALNDNADRYVEHIADAIRQATSG